jgi:hypothetical protein
MDAFQAERHERQILYFAKKRPQFFMKYITFVGYVKPVPFTVFVPNLRLCECRCYHRN